MKRWRIATGIVMWLYIGSHMINHSLGLISLHVAEQGLRIMVSVVHWLPITILLYGAFAVHLVLAILGLLQRRSLRMPAIDAIRICLGLGFPLLLIGHVFSTRVIYEWYQLPPEYSRVVAGLIASGSEGRQLALLAPGWLHGCLGLDMSLRRRPYLLWWRRLFIVLAILLPILAGAGYLTMESEVSKLLGDSSWRINTLKHLSLEQRDTLIARRETVLWGYIGAIALAVCVPIIVRRARRFRVDGN